MEEFRIQLKELSIEFKARDWRQENFTNRISLPSNYSALPSGKILSMLLNIRLALEEGRLGVAVPIGYLPGASLEEFFRVYQLAGELQVPIITHVRN